ncbi:AAR2, N-terminal,AAR2, C-terminal,A1 cistron-splicing factor, AAR2 [Cinara cedri]|uniref:Protein AAR2 homolog n=1 Tax=Cinara cedri TaxID=506608 RepID=A0A5E4NSA8_9HEMI|nr:AAR2, N-terminal,AAR2, C-terminal,A1 cistron-splicing factor, AAR2 [Cinara cedri]
MDQDTAMKLYLNGATAFFLDVPSGMEFGIDMMSWATGDKFKGIKMIPPGIHFMYYSATDKYGNTAPRCGFFHSFKKGECLIKKWDKDNEILVDDIPKAELIQYKTNVLHYDNCLGPYPYEEQAKWNGLSSLLTENLIDKLSPETKLIQSAMELFPTSTRENTKKRRKWGPIRSETDVGYEHLPKLVPKEENKIRYTEPPEYHYPPGASLSEITKYSLDTSYILHQMIEKHDCKIDLLAELQFSYICFLLGLSYESFERWKKLFQLFCMSKDAVEEDQNYFAKFFVAIRFQLETIPEDFLVDIVENNNVIYNGLKELFRTLEISDFSLEDNLKDGTIQIKRYLLQKFGWEFNKLDEEDEDEAPVIVDCEEY